MPTAELGDVDLYYEIHGKGKPLVMIQGYSGNLDGWDAIEPRVENLSEHYQVITLDNRGTGRSSKPEGPYSITGMADDVAGLLSHLGIGRASVYGHSMGGFIALEMALRHPERVDKLVLISTSPGGSAFDLPGQREAKDKIRWMFSPPSEMSEEEWVDELFGVVYYPAFYEANRDRLLAPSTEHLTVRETLVKQFDAISLHDTVDRLGSIAARTLVIHGANDLLVFPEAGRILADNIPDASLLMVDEAGHGVQEEKWGELLPKIVEFLG